MRIENEHEVPSPALLVYRSRIEANLDRMLSHAGGPDRLRPHVKTHKTPQVVTMQVQRGITRCKAATIAEAEMAAGAGASDILLAVQPVGPAVTRLLGLVDAYPGVRFRTLVDDAAAAHTLGAAFAARGAAVDVLLDLDVGQHRTGVAPGREAVALARRLIDVSGVRLVGLHAYDGHLVIPDPAERLREVDALHVRLGQLRDELERGGVEVPLVVAGGTPTFAMHASRGGVECSPGTSVLWDAGYQARLSDLHFTIAAALLGRVISRPGSDRLCLDLGHKAVASEMPHPRIVFPAFPDARAHVHSEEHLVIETAHAARFPVGSVVYGIPWHICPTVALHSSLHVVEAGRVVEEWPVTARARRLAF